MSTIRYAAIDPAKRAMLLTALFMAQDEFGYLSQEALGYVAQRLAMPVRDVYSAATFYSMFHFQPVGRHVIQVCEGLSCSLAGGAERLAAYLEHRLGIKVGETTPDGLFTLKTVQCLASCGTSPAMRIDDTLHENLTTERVDMILKSLGGQF